jgi:hypothetical protein
MQVLKFQMAFKLSLFGSIIVWNTDLCSPRANREQQQYHLIGEELLAQLPHWLDLVDECAARGRRKTLQ